MCKYSSAVICLFTFLCAVSVYDAEHENVKDIASCSIPAAVFISELHDNDC